MAKTEEVKEVWLTRRMFGEKMEKIAECRSFDDAMTAIFNWKEARKADPEYKIEEYDRIICGGEMGTAVDFGDYSYFMLVVPAGKPADIS